jgi:hypothetical protein
MNYLIQAYNGKQELLGTQNATLVHDCKSYVKVKNALNRFKPESRATQIKVFSYSNLYDEKTYKLIQTISHETTI